MGYEVEAERHRPLPQVVRGGRGTGGAGEGGRVGTGERERVVTDETGRIGTGFWERERDPRRASLLAGIMEGTSAEARVEEWRRYVSVGPGD